MSDETKDIMAHEPVLPEDFDGVFRFSNFSDADFVGTWNKKEYTFPAESTVPMVMTDHSPIEIQHIRKHFAKKLAEREFFKGDDYKIKSGLEGKPGERTMSGIHQATAYTMDELAPLIQKCLQPMKDAKIKVADVAKVDIKEKLSRDDDGNLNSEAISGKDSLKSKALSS